MSKDLYGNEMELLDVDGRIKNVPAFMSSHDFTKCKVVDLYSELYSLLDQVKIGGGYCYNECICNKCPGDEINCVEDLDFHMSFEEDHSDFIWSIFQYFSETDVMSKYILIKKPM